MSEPELAALLAAIERMESQQAEVLTEVRAISRRTEQVEGALRAFRERGGLLAKMLGGG